MRFREYALRVFACVPPVMAFCVALGLPPVRAFELAVIPVIMALPFLGMVRLWPASRRLTWQIYGVWTFSWMLGVLFEVFLTYRFKLPLRSREVVEAVVNSPPAEAKGFLAAVAGLLLAALVASAVTAFVMARSARRVADDVLARWDYNRWHGLAAIVIIVVPIAAHGNPVVGRADPISYWSWLFLESRDILQLQQEIHDQKAQAVRNLPQWNVVYHGPPKKTVVVVIGESSNRWDWSLYGYSRKTTPQLDSRRAGLLAFTDVVSSYGSTTKALTRALTIADHTDDDSWRTQPTVLRLARAAGYKVWFLANPNQSSRYFEITFGEDADVHHEGTNGPSGYLDERMLPELDAALQDPAPLKLVILHTVGSHDDYDRRYSARFATFGKQDDQVDAELKHRWWWVRHARNAYDNSILYTDFILASVLDRLHALPDGDNSFLYFSDHGEDVGHLTHSFGHEFFLESGFTVPLIFWSNRPGFPTAEEKALEGRAYQTDELEWTVLPMLSISTSRDRPEFDLLGKGYRPWQRVIAGRPYVPLKTHLGSEGRISGR